jgi:hypothetical protein
MVCGEAHVRITDDRYVASVASGDVRAHAAPRQVIALVPAPPRRDVNDTVVRLIQVYEARNLPARAAAYRAALSR